MILKTIYYTYYLKNFILMKSLKQYPVVFAVSVKESKAMRLKVLPIDSQKEIGGLYVRCNKNLRDAFPQGTVYRFRADLLEGKKGIRFLSSKKKYFERAIEFFEHNLRVQMGSFFEPVNECQDPGS